MKKSKTLILALFLIILSSTACNNSKKTESPIAPQATTDKTTTQDQTKEFKSKLGYTMSYPADWIVDDSLKTAPAEFIREPSNKAYVSIQVFQDNRIIKDGGRELILQEIKDGFTKDTSYKIANFELEGNDMNTAKSYQALGSHKDKDGTTWMFREIGSLTDTGTLMTFRGSVIQNEAKIYGPMVDNIIFSFKR
ncbi:MAG: PsbP-related protein [Candidatus Gracilibacteria bacterium]|jgi:hypothetical protein